MTDEIEFEAQVARVQTMADGGLRFTFDTGERWIMQAAQLMECKRYGVWLTFKAEPLINKGNKNGTTKRNHKQSEWTPAEQQSIDGDSQTDGQSDNRR